MWQRHEAGPFMEAYSERAGREEERDIKEREASAEEEREGWGY